MVSPDVNSNLVPVTKLPMRIFGPAGQPGWPLVFPPHEPRPADFAITFLRPSKSPWEKFKRASIQLPRTIICSITSGSIDARSDGADYLGLVCGKLHRLLHRRALMALHLRSFGLAPVDAKTLLHSHPSGSIFFRLILPGLWARE